MHYTYTYNYDYDYNYTTTTYNYTRTTTTTPTTISITTTTFSLTLQLLLNAPFSDKDVFPFLNQSHDSSTDRGNLYSPSHKLIYEPIQLPRPSKYP